MANLVSHLYIILVFFHTLFHRATTNRKFSDFKRCADDECSMLLCRGKAASDFSGPDCRFLSFKKGETIYVYYKLSGQRSDLWAGSVGSRFGYFPKDFLLINHIYTDKELEILAEETDFVCFDTGLDKFDSYDVDVLLGNSVLLSDNKDTNLETKELQEQNGDSKLVTEDIEPSPEESHDDVDDVDDVDEHDERDEHDEHDDHEDHDDDDDDDDDGKDTDVSEHMDEQSDADSVVLGEDSSKVKLTVPSQSSTVTERTVPDAVSDDSQTRFGDSKSVTEDVDVSTESNDNKGRNVGGTEHLNWHGEADIPDAESDDPQPNEDSKIVAEAFDVSAEESHGHEWKNIDGSEHVAGQSEADKLSPGENSSDVNHAVPSQSSTVTETTVPDAVSNDSQTNGASKFVTEDVDVSTEESNDNKGRNVDAIEHLNGHGEADIPDAVSDDSQPKEDSKFVNEDVDASTEDSHDSEWIDVSEADELALGEDSSNVKLTGPSQSPPTETTVPDAVSDDSQTNGGSKFVTEDIDVSTEVSHDSEGTDIDGTERLDGQDEADSVPLEEDSSNVKLIVPSQSSTVTETTVPDAVSDDSQLNGDSKSVNEDLDVSTEEFHDSERIDVNDTEQSDGQSEADKLALGEDSSKVKLTVSPQSSTVTETVPDAVSDDSQPNKGSKFVNEDVAIAKERSHYNKLRGIYGIEHLVGQSEVDKLTRGEDSGSVKPTVPSQSSTVIETTGPDAVSDDSQPTGEPEYSDSILRLSILRDYFKEEDMLRIQRYLGLKNLFGVEAMFTDLEQELRSARDSQSDTNADIEQVLESILEASEISILDEIEKMLDARELEAKALEQDTDMFDEEAAILDDFQELAFHLRQKYSASSESAPLVMESQHHIETEADNHEILEDLGSNLTEPESVVESEIHEEDHDVKSHKVGAHDNMLHNQEVGIEEDSGHFNKNKDSHSSLKDPEEVQRGPQAILESPLEVGFSIDIESSSSGSLESPSVSDIHEDEANDDVSSAPVMANIWSLCLKTFECLGVYAEMLIAALPEEWQPGPTFHGLPWEPVVTTAAVGILTFLVFFWRTILAVKSRTYQLTEKQLADRIQKLLNEKSDALLKITELNNMIKEREEQQKETEKSRDSNRQEKKELQVHFGKLQKKTEEMVETISVLNQGILDEQNKNKELDDMVASMHKSMENLRLMIRNGDAERAKFQALVDEAKLREDVLRAEVLSFTKENGALKKQKKSLLCDAKEWEGKHKELSERIKVYQKSQKDLEDSLKHKENEIDVLSDCIAQLGNLEACDGDELQKGDTQLANGEAIDKKSDTMKARMRQMMDVSRVKTTIAVVEEERNCYLEKLLSEEGIRQSLEEQVQKLEHDRSALENEKSNLENQHKTLQQKLEIMTDMYMEKDNALQRKLTQEELERRDKETRLSEVDGQAIRAEEELKTHKQRIQDLEEVLQKTERSYKTQISTLEKKAHETWLNARASERALVEEKREMANLRQKLVEVNDKLAEFQRPLFKPTPGPPERHMPPMRRGDSYGPSPVSGGAPSPPLMIEGPGRPPSAPVGRRIEPFGPRPPSDPHGRYSDLGHPLPARPEIFAPRTSSPNISEVSQTAPVEAKAEASAPASAVTQEALSKSQSQGSFLPSPIRDSPGPGQNVLVKGHGPLPMEGHHPLPPNGPLPPMMRPPNGHPSMIPPGVPPFDSRFGPPAPDPRYGPAPHDPRYRAPLMGPYGHPLPSRHFGPVPPFVRGPPVPLRDYPPIGPPPPPFGPSDYHPDYLGPKDVPPRPWPPGAMPPMGLLPPPSAGAPPRAVPLPPRAGFDNHESSLSNDLASTQIHTAPAGAGQATGHPLQQEAAQEPSDAPVVEF